MRTASITATLLGGALLFLVEPMIAKMVLPALGGTPAVWSTCMLFFQTVLLAGYAYAHLLSARPGPGARALVHALVLAASLFFLPLRLTTPSAPPAGGWPVPWLLATLAASVGLPFFVLSATGPLVQRWLHGSGHPAGADPYALYAVGNLGSLAGLLGYPLFVEPFLALRTSRGSFPQSEAWSVAYGAFALVAGLLTVLAWRRSRLQTAPAPVARARPEPLAPRARLFWLLLAFVPSSALLAVTQYMSTDLTVFPLLWVLPLAIYLVTLILAFSGRAGPPVWSSVGLACTAVGVVASFWVFRRPYPWVLLVLHPLTLFFLGLVCHGRLARARPDARSLTEFYLFVGLGGALGGAFNTLLAPVLFDSVAEYPLVLLLACLLRSPVGRTPAKDRGRARVLDVALPAVLLAVVATTKIAAENLALESTAGTLLLHVAVPCVLALALLRRPVRFALGLAVLLGAASLEARPTGQVLHVRRDFFGVHKVLRLEGPGVPFHVLYDGTTRHGAQAVVQPLRGIPTSYYHRTGPLGEVFEALDGTDRLERIAAVGLGAGTIAAYGREGRAITFYEIDPEVVRIARDERLFTYLRDARGRVDVEIGDGRVGLGRAPDGLYGLIVLDAFSSDAVPVHLMTREAVELCFRKLRPDGLLAAHVTNQHLDLEPVFHAIASDLHLVGRSKSDEVISIEQMLQGKDRSHWVVLARDRAFLGPLLTHPDWLEVPLVPDAPPDRRFLWTDNYSSVLRILRIW